MKDTKVGGVGVVFRPKAALYGNWSAGKVLEKWASYSPQMAINLPDAESNSLAV